MGANRGPTREWGASRMRMSAQPSSAELRETLDVLLLCAAGNFRVVPLNGFDGARKCECQGWRDRNGKGPCPTPGKHPWLSKWQDRATADVATIRNWHRTYP